MNMTEIDLDSVGRTNHVHSTQEKQVIRRRLLDAREGLQGTKAGDSTAIPRYEELIDRIRRYNVALAPHKELPAEIVCFIFKLCCQEAAEIPIVRHTNIHFNLTHVCSAWRRMMLGTPWFWNNIRVEVRSNKISQTALVVREWLHRAEDAPVSMTLLDTYTRCSVARPRPLPSLIRELIAPYNFRKLDVMLDNKHMEYLIALPEEYLSSCEELRLHCSPTGACTYRNIPRLGFRKFHNLEALHLQRVNLDVRSMSWHRLRSFSITKTAMRISACWDILRRGSGTLEFCELSVFEDQLMDHMEIIHCPKLRHFGVTFLHGLDRGHQINPFLLRLRLSSLESLSIPAPMLKRVALELSTLTQLQENCNIQLKRLFIGRTINTFDLRDILQCVPSVQQLGLDGKVVLHPDVFRDLSLGTLGRHLDDLGIKIVYGKDIHGFLEMVKRRNASKRIIDENACDDATYSKFVSIRCIADVRLTAPSTIELVREIKEQRVCLTIEPLQERSHWDSDIELEPDGGPDNDTSFME